MTDNDLKSDLMEIKGVGDATADEILSVLAEHDTGQSPYVEKALQAAREGDDRQAAIYLRRAGND